MREQNHPKVGRLDRRVQELLAQEDGHHGAGLEICDMRCDTMILVSRICPRRDVNAYDGWMDGWVFDVILDGVSRGSDTNRKVKNHTSVVCLRGDL